MPYTNIHKTKYIYCISTIDYLLKIEYIFSVNNEKTVLCVVRHVLKEPYLTIQSQGQEKTWIAEKFPFGFNLVHMHGKQSGKLLTMFDNFHENIRLKHSYVSKIFGILEDFFLYPMLSYIPSLSVSKKMNSRYPVFQINFFDIYLTIRWKFFAIFDFFVYKTNYDYLLITTTNAYIRPESFMKLIENIPKNSVYTGAYAWPGAFFISGANIILSRDVVVELLNNRKIFKPSIIDDVELSNVLNKLGIQHFGKPLINVSSEFELESISSNLLLDNYHFRMKTIGNRLANETNLMRKMHSVVKELERNDVGDV